MIRLKTFIILIIIYIIAFVSLKYDLNLFYPIDLVRNYLLMPVIAISDNKELENTTSFNENVIESLKEEIKELKSLTNIKTVLSDYSLVNASVIARNRNYWFNTITIDKGSNDGITKDMAVIDKFGLVGKISHVYKNMSEIKLITTSDINNKTSVVIKNKDENIYGIIEKYSDSFLEVTLINKNSNITKGLDVLTTGMGGIYPNGILIGETVDIKKAKYDVGLIVLVKPVGDFNNLKYVSILKRN